MTTKAVVFFYMQEKTAGRRHPWQRVRFPIQEMEWEGRRLVAAGLPEYDYKRKRWKEEKLRQKIHTVLAPSLDIKPETTAFLCHNSLNDEEEYLQVLEQCFSLERETPEDILHLMVQEYCQFDALVVQDGRELHFDVEGFLREYSGKVNFLAVVTENEAAYEELFEELYEEYGLAAMTAASMKELHIPVKYHTLVADAGLSEKSAWLHLPAGCIYLDLLSLQRRQRVLETRRKDIRYLSFYKLVEKKLRQKCEFLRIRP